MCLARRDPRRARAPAQALIRAVRSGAALLAWALALPSGADPDAPPDKSGYHLLNPTPRALMRELSPDRPDATESPLTLDAGHVQIETSFVDYERDESGGEEQDSWAVLDTNLKLGLTNRVDLQLLFTPHRWERTDPGSGSRATQHGFGDLTLRVKGNVWGNDPEPGQRTAFGIMPALKLPTGTDVSNDHVEGGLIHAFAWRVSDRASLGAMVQFDFVYDDGGRDYDTDLVHTATLGFDVVGAAGAYLEYEGVGAIEGSADYRPSISSGLTLGIGVDAVLDAGVKAALSDAAPVVNVFSGITVRF